MQVTSDARNELWYVLELAKTLGQSSSFTVQPPSTAARAAPAKKAKSRGPRKVTDAEAKPAPSISSLPGEPPVLPPGTYASTPSLLPPKSSHIQVYELELALAAKQRALEDCSSAIDSAVEELLSMAQAGEEFWQQVRTLKNGTKGKSQWAVVPKPDFARSMAEGERAKDLVIPYAVDEGTAFLTIAIGAFSDLV